jgi:hypothetical protein
VGGIAFQVLNAGTPVGAAFTTDFSGRAISALVPRGVALTVHEVAPPTGFSQDPDVSVTVDQPAVPVTIVNQEIAGLGPGPNYTV